MRIAEIFEENNGSLSFIRSITGFVTATIMLNWVVCCLRTNTFIPLDIGAVAAIIGLAASKVMQKGKENET